MVNLNSLSLNLILQVYDAHIAETASNLAQIKEVRKQMRMQHETMVLTQDAQLEHLQRSIKSCLETSVDVSVCQRAMERVYATADHIELLEHNGNHQFHGPVPKVVVASPALENDSASNSTSAAEAPDASTTATTTTTTTTTTANNLRGWLQTKHKSQAQPVNNVLRRQELLLSVAYHSEVLERHLHRMRTQEQNYTQCLQQQVTEMMEERRSMETVLRMRKLDKMHELEQDRFQIQNQILYHQRVKIQQLQATLIGEQQTNTEITHRESTTSTTTTSASSISDLQNLQDAMAHRRNRQSKSFLLAENLKATRENFQQLRQHSFSKAHAHAHAHASSSVNGSTDEKDQSVLEPHNDNQSCGSQKSAKSHWSFRSNRSSKSKRSHSGPVSFFGRILFGKSLDGEMEQEQPPLPPLEISIPPTSAFGFMDELRKERS